MSEVLVGHSYYLHFDPKLWKAMQPYPPLGTMYAAATLRSRGYQVSIFDSMLAESEADWETALRRTKPRFAVLFEDNFNYLSKMCLLRMRHAAFRMIKAAKNQRCTVIVGGADASDQPELYLQQGADFVLIGEGEITLAELLDRVSDKSDTPFSEIAGLAYSSQNHHLEDHLPAPTQGEIIHTRRRADIRELDSLPYPAWDLVDIEHYEEIWRNRHGYFSMNMVTTRGCPFHCNWCAKPIWGQRYNSRSPENVASELAWLKQKYQPDHIWFADDILGLKPGWLRRFADAVTERDISTPYKALSRVDLLLREGEVEALKRSGARIIWVGAESGSQKILDAMEKGTRIDQIQCATQRLHNAGIEVGYFLQFGYPGENWEDIKKTLQLINKFQPDDIGISVSYPLPGTPFHERVKRQMGTKQNWIDSEDMAMLYQGTYPTSFYRQLSTVAHKTFRACKHWRALKKEIWRPANWNRTFVNQAIRMLYYGLTLPFENLKLQIQMRMKRHSFKQLTPALTQEQAATPTAQD